jgi:hypothetical protein
MAGPAVTSGTERAGPSAGQVLPLACDSATVSVQVVAVGASVERSLGRRQLCPAARGLVGLRDVAGVSVSGVVGAKDPRLDQRVHRSMRLRG